MSEQFRKGDHVTTVNDPLLGKSVSISMDTGSFYSPTFVVIVESGIAGAFSKLLTVDIAEKVVLIRLVLSVF